MENTEAIKNDATTSETGAPEKPKVKSYHPIEVRPMTRKKVKDFHATGLDHVMNRENVNDPSKLVAMTDWIIDNIYGDLADITDNFEFYQLRDLAMDTCNRIYSGPESIKN